MLGRRVSAGANRHSHEDRDFATFPSCGRNWPLPRRAGVRRAGDHHAPAAMRRAPSAHSHIVQTIPANAQIDVENCSGGWCYASWRNLFGYVPAFAVAQGGRRRSRLPSAGRRRGAADRRRPGLRVGRSLCRRRLGLRLAPLVAKGQAAGAPTVGRPSALYA